MVSSRAVEPVASGSAQNNQDYRYRSATGERTVLPDRAQKPPPEARPRDEQRRQDKRQAPAPNPAPPRSGSSMFAAAVIAGTMPPRPQSMQELLRRIGISEIPPESEARLRDILA